MDERMDREITEDNTGRQLVELLDEKDQSEPVKRICNPLATALWMVLIEVVFGVLLWALIKYW